LLRLTDVHTFYGKIHALKGVSLNVDSGEIVAILGANGGGKSTLIKTISGFQPCREGKIFFGGQEIAKLRPEQIVSRGVGIVFERREIFTSMTVRENLELGAFSRLRRRQCDKKKLAEDIKDIFQLFPALQGKSNALSGSLSGGQQQMLAIGRTLMSKPTLLLMDEPSMGLAPLLVREIYRVIKELSSLDVTLVLVEQNSHAALAVCDRAYILQTGSVVLTDTAANLRSNPELATLYLGGQDQN